MHGLMKEGPDFYRDRMKDMNVDEIIEGEGYICGRRDGTGKARVLAAPWPTDTDTRASAAVLISLAKAWDGAAAPPSTLLLCITQPDAALPPGEVQKVGPMAPGALTTSPVIQSGTYKPDRPPGDVDFEALVTKARRVYEWSRE